MGVFVGTCGCREFLSITGMFENPTQVQQHRSPELQGNAHLSQLFRSEETLRCITEVSVKNTETCPPLDY